MKSSVAVSLDLQLQAKQLSKTFTLHTQAGIRLPVLQAVSLDVARGECVALAGASGSGKSTFMRCLYGNYRVDSGSVLLKHQGEWVDLTQAEPHQIISLRQTTLGYVSQFLRVIPRVPAIAVVAEPLLELGIALEVALERAGTMLSRLNVPERLWQLSPTTFSGGEKQRVNIARNLMVNYPILLLDEPTSALDSTNRQVVIDLLEERKAQGCAIVGIFHDDEVRAKVCTRELVFGAG